MNVDPVDDSQDDTAHGRHQGGDGPGQGEDPADVDAQGEGRRLVVRHGPHVDPLGGILEKEPEKNEKDEADGGGQDVHGGNGDPRPLKGQPGRKKFRKHVEVAAEDEEHDPLEHGRQPHGEHDDEDEGFPDEGPEEDPFDDEPQGETAREGQGEGQEDGDFRPGHEGQKEEGADGHQLAVGEIQDAGGLEDHDEPQGRQAVEETDTDAADEKLKKEFHGHSSTSWIRTVVSMTPVRPSR